MMVYDILQNMDCYFLIWTVKLVVCIYELATSDKTIFEARINPQKREPQKINDSFWLCLLKM